MTQSSVSGGQGISMLLAASKEHEYVHVQPAFVSGVSVGQVSLLELLCRALHMMIVSGTCRGP